MKGGGEGRRRGEEERRGEGREVWVGEGRREDCHDPTVGKWS